MRGTIRQWTEQNGSSPSPEVATWTGKMTRPSKLGGVPTDFPSTFWIVHLYFDIGFDCCIFTCTTSSVVFVLCVFLVHFQKCTKKTLIPLLLWWIESYCSNHSYHLVLVGRISCTELSDLLWCKRSICSCGEYSILLLLLLLSERLWVSDNRIEYAFVHFKQGHTWTDASARQNDRWMVW